MLFGWSFSIKEVSPTEMNSYACFFLRFAIRQTSCRRRSRLRTDADFMRRLCMHACDPRRVGFWSLNVLQLERLPRCLLSLQWWGFCPCYDKNLVLRPILVAPSSRTFQGPYVARGFTVTSNILILE